MRKNIDIFFLSLFGFAVLAIMCIESARAADPNDFRDPTMWQRERSINDAVNKSSVNVEAQKTYPVSTLDSNGKPIKQIRNAKATITLGASASNVGKSLIKRAPAIVITQALVGLGLGAADWLMDEENNSIKYIEQTPVTGTGYYWGVQSDVTNASTAEQACRNYVALVNNGSVYSSVSAIHTQYATVGFYWCYMSKNGVISETQGYRKGSPAETVLTEKSIPIDTVATQVIADAEAGNAPAMEVMNDAALDALEAGMLDPQLDVASDIPQPDHQQITQEQFDNPDYPVAGTGAGATPTDTTDPTDPTNPTDPEAKPFELPPFCAWANKVCDFIDWVKTEPPEPPESGDVDVQIPDANMHVPILERLYVDMPAQCPADPVLEFMGARIPFPMSVFCQFAAMMKPLILLFAYIKGLSIIGTGLS